MLASIILAIFILIIVFIVFIEYRNEKKYQAKRRAGSQNRRTPQKKPKDVKEVTRKPEPKIEVEVPEKVKPLPEGNYPTFTHIRLLEMGLSDEESKEFVRELIPQLEIQIPLIEEAMNIPDFHQVERLTHSIKGSATNLGTGGISDLLVDFNTYVKTGTDIDIVKAYFNHLVHYTSKLKTQYS